ncbi:hypothetical protein [Pseudooceanicola sp. 200-1SW]|uniref:hypothetical protein n=1 Tax=Pseudooceanicola sp. 200-1SW TaxID=3425949 RepID=UPI003D7FF8A2
MTEERGETKRDRVRRLLLTPLADIGFHWKRGTDPAEGQNRLDRLADELAYLSDRDLGRLFECMRTKGQGAARNLWPAHATFIAFAQEAEGRPLAEMPGLASWFASRAGRDALEGDRLVAEFWFWQRYHCPPVRDHQRRLVETKAAEIRDRVMRIRDKLRREVQIDEVDRRYLARVERDEAAALALVKHEAAA